MDLVTTTTQAHQVTVSDDVRELFGSSISESTRRAYAGHCKRYQAWCGRFGFSSKPASPQAAAYTVAEYIAFLTKEGRKVSTIQQAVSAVALAYETMGLTNLTKAPIIKKALSGAKRLKGEAVTKKKAATVKVIYKMLVSIEGDSLKAKRDRALIAFGFAGAFRRSELVALSLEDIQTEDDGAIVTIRRSKTDQTGKGQTIAIPNGSFIEPLKLLREWVEAAGIVEGPIFQRLNRHGTLMGPMSPQAVALVMKERARAIGEDATQFAGHSLRSGYITSGVEAGADALAISEVSRHKNLDVLKGYVRRGNLLKDHFGEKFL